MDGFERPPQEIGEQESVEEEIISEQEALQENIGELSDKFEKLGEVNIEKSLDDRVKEKIIAIRSWLSEDKNAIPLAMTAGVGMSMTLMQFLTGPEVSQDSLEKAAYTATLTAASWTFGKLTHQGTRVFEKLLNHYSEKNPEVE